MKDKNEINDIGIKAYSLKLLKEEGLMEDSLYVSKVLPEKDEFFRELKKAGFRDGSDISARTSHPNKSILLPRQPCSSFEEAYSFYKENLKDGMVIVAHDFFHAHYGGIISLINDEMVLEMTETDWNIDLVLDTDTAIFDDEKATWYLYKGVRKVGYVEGDEEKFKTIQPLREKEIKKLHKHIVSKLDKLRNILNEDNNSLEILISKDYKLFPLQLTKVVAKGSSGVKSNNDEEVFEILTPLDLRKWDRKMPLLISIPTSVDRADGLMSVISDIKKYTDKVYISYGVLSHPAILLREAGISVERKMSNYEVLKLAI